jgi:hypothetical protein
MDLRAALKTDAQREEATRLLDYQPFIISDNVQTGAAYSWMNGSDPRVRPQLLFRRNEETDERWSKISDANGRLRRMYDDFVATIAEHYPSGSLLDLACNNGYFPVRASTLGMRAFGTDSNAKHALAVRLLNDALGTRAQFQRRLYDSRRRCTIWQRVRVPWPLNLPRCDVVSMVAIMCHLPDPLGFLTYAGSRAKEAIFFMGQAVDTEHFLVSYQRPHANTVFPVCLQRQHAVVARPIVSRIRADGLPQHHRAAVEDRVVTPALWDGSHSHRAPGARRASWLRTRVRLAAHRRSGDAHLITPQLTPRLLLIC